MRKTLLFASIGLCIGVLVALSCRRSDIRTVVVNVPQMTDDKIVRIITNAVLDEIVGRYDGVKHDYEIDLAKGLVFYHESHRLRSTVYQQLIQSRLKEVGYDARMMGARLNPPALVKMGDEYKQLWPYRFTLTISIPGMKSGTDANIVTDAIAYARVGKDDPRIRVRRKSKSLVVTYEGLHLSPQNVEVAIACAGFSANDVPANLGAADSIPYGWRPVRPSLKQ